jgi:PST family polysaccharide transporter
MTKNKNVQLFKKVLLYGFIINCAVIASFYFIFPIIVPYIFIDFSEQSQTALNILLLSNVLSLPATFLGYPFLAALGYPNSANISLLIVAVFNITVLLFFWWIGVISIYSVAILVVISELLLLLVRFYYSCKYRLFR